MDGKEQETGPDREQEAEARAQQTLDWLEAFDSAWDALEAQEVVGPWGGPDYRRAVSICIKEGIEGNQTQLRFWILGLARRAAYEGLTLKSKRRRASRG